MEIYAALFGHAPLYVKVLLVIRNWLAGLAGLDVPTIDDIMHVRIEGTYRAGDRIGPWPVYACTDHEIVAGRDNRHLDFRLSVLREASPGPDRVTVSTICTVHNLAGKIYLFFVVPFHRFGVKRLIANAVAAHRI